MNAFEAWNLRLLEHFFSPGPIGKEVFIGTPPDVLDDIGEGLGGDAGFLEAVKAGPDWKWRRKPPTLESRLQELVDRRTSSAARALGYADPGKRNCEFMPGGAIEYSAPTYLPYLAALARGAAVADVDGYYACLREDLGLPPNWSSNQMSRTEAAWADLAKWTKDTGGRYGKFTFRRLGAHQFVGLAKSQVMIAARDIQVLHELFERLRLEVGQGKAAIRLEDVLEGIRAENSGVSRGLRQAALDHGYRDVLEARLIDIHGEWKGPETSCDEAHSSRAGKRAEKRGGVSFGLTLGPNDSLPWRVVIGIEDELVDLAQVEDTPLLGEPGGTAASTRRSMRRHRLGGWALPLSTEESKSFLMQDSWTLETPQGSFPVERARKARVLTEGGDESYELWDSGWPEYGAAVVLFPDAGDESHARFTAACPAASPYGPRDMEGLPSSWAMYYVDACECLTDEQRAIVEPSGRRVRLLVLQGGSKDEGKYLHYDLPNVVYRGPPEWRVKVVGRDDLELEEDSCAPITRAAQSGRQGSATVTRCYGLPPAFEVGGELKLVALDEAGKERGSCALGIQSQATASAAVADGDASMDRFGRIVKGPDGLRGGLPEHLVRTHERGRGNEVIASTRLRQDVGKPANFEGIRDNPAVLFLDALSREGGYSYGRAKSKLDRFLAKAGSTQAPWRVLLDLWRRGHVELKRGKDGGIEHVHSVPARAYSIPMKVDGWDVLGLLGTLSLSQWRNLCEESLVWEILKNDFGLSDEGTLPVLRLRSKVTATLLKQRLYQIGMGMLPMQGLAIANWAATERDVRSMMLAETKQLSESIQFMGLSRFDPLAIRYVDIRSGHPPPLEDGEEAVLYKFEDARRKGWYRNMFVSRRGASFALDEQWSKWIAMAYVARGFGRAPVFHDLEKRHLYVPAKLRLPIVIDRALLLCSGSPPVECRLDAWEDGRDVRFGFKQVGTALFRLDEGLCQGVGDGVWLRYDNVPPAVMKAISSKGK